jgi:hypothetical protein
MNKKTLVILAVIFAIFVIIYFVQRGFVTSTSDLDKMSELNIEFNKDAVAKVSVYKQAYPDSGLHFEMVNNQWIVKNAYGAPAKAEELDKLFTDLLGVTGTIRAESADLYSEFDISDELALQIEFFDSADNKLTHLYVGKGGGSGRSCFMRLAGSPAVYLADENFISRFAAWNSPPEKNLPKNRWIQLELCDVDQEDINSIKLKKGRDEYEFAKVELPSSDTLMLNPPQTEWKQVSPEKGVQLDKNKINNLYSIISSIRAADAADPVNIDNFGLDNPSHYIWIAGASGKTSKINFSKPFNDDKDRYAVVEGRNALYLIKDSNFIRYFETPFESN